jgi:hypothetical protein
MRCGPCRSWRIASGAVSTRLPNLHLITVSHEQPEQTPPSFGWSIWLRLRKPRNEYMFSEMPPIADGSELCRLVWGGQEQTHAPQQTNNHLSVNAHSGLPGQFKRWPPSLRGSSWDSQMNSAAARMRVGAVGATLGLVNRYHQGMAELPQSLREVTFAVQILDQINLAAADDS